jgi:hypothetical protein
MRRILFYLAALAVPFAAGAPALAQFTGDTDEGLGGVAHLSRLETLSLRKTQVTDDGLDDLKGLTSLHDLDLEGTAVPPETAAEKRQRLLSEKAELEWLIEDARQRAEQCEHDAEGASQLAEEAESDDPPQLTSAAAYRQAALAFRQEAAEIRGQIAEYQGRLSEIEAELSSLGG